MAQTMVDLASLLAGLALLLVSSVFITAGTTSFGGGRNVGFISKPKAVMFLVAAVPITTIGAYLLLRAVT